MTATRVDAAALRGIDASFAARAAEHHAPSTSYGVFDRRGVVHTGGTGEIDGRAPTAGTVYRVASCTKSFTAVALLVLRDAGVIGLDDAVTDYVPAFGAVRLPSVDSPVPSIRMLLTMSGGLPTDDPWGDRQEAISDDELDALLDRGLTFDSVPGTAFAYSNLGYALLGRVVAVASGRPYREVVERDILAPLGLTDTGFEVPSAPVGGLAIGYRRRADSWEPLPFSGAGAFSPIGGLFSSVNDLARWARWLSSAFGDPGIRDDASGDAEGDVDGILSRASRREMQQGYRYAKAFSEHPVAYGFGLVVEQHPRLGPIVSHSGGYPGFAAHMRWHPASGIGMVGFENATAARVSAPITSALESLLLESDAEPRPCVWAETRAAGMLVERVLRGADVPVEALSPNVDLDLSLLDRRRLWNNEIERIGGLGAIAGCSVEAGTELDAAHGEESAAPSHLVYRIAGGTGSLRVEIRLTPEAPPRIQTLLVRAEAPKF